METPHAIRGDVLVDRMVGWAVVVLSVLVVLLGLAIPHEGQPTSFAEAFNHYRWLVITVIGGAAVSRSTRTGHVIALAAFGVRLAIDTIELGIRHGDRFLSMAWTFDLVMMGFAFLRLRALNNKKGMDDESSMPESPP